MNFLDLFAGIGGFRLGMEMAGHKCEGYVEIDKFARKSYEAIHNTKGEWKANDITSITNDDIRWLRDNRRIDVICGGFPCQAFSVAGKRGGFDDARGTLFFEIMRIANIIRPRYLFLENVKGLLNHDKGITFETILRTLDEVGYDAEWEVLNSKDFGVPQNRERVFIIGHLRGSSTRKVFPIRRTDRHIGNDIKRLAHSRSYRRVLQTFDRRGSIEALDTMQGGHRQPCVAVVGNVNPSGKGMNGQVYDAEGLSPTLTTNNGEGSKIIKGYRIRKLTPRECWRLQGFPDCTFDKATEVNSDSQLYKQAGNSVTVNVIYEIAKKLV